MLSEEGLQKLKAKVERAREADKLAAHRAKAFFAAKGRIQNKLKALAQDASRRIKRKKKASTDMIVDSLAGSHHRAIIAWEERMAIVAENDKRAMEAYRSKVSRSLLHYQDEMDSVHRSAMRALHTRSSNPLRGEQRDGIVDLIRGISLHHNSTMALALLAHDFLEKYNAQDKHNVGEEHANAATSVSRYSALYDSHLGNMKRQRKELLLEMQGGTFSNRVAQNWIQLLLRQILEQQLTRHKGAIELRMKGQHQEKDIGKKIVELRRGTVEKFVASLPERIDEDGKHLLAILEAADNVEEGMYEVLSKKMNDEKSVIAKEALRDREISRKWAHASSSYASGASVGSSRTSWRRAVTPRHVGSMTWNLRAQMS